MNAEFQKAIPLLLTLQQLDPSDEFAAQAIPDIYTRMGQSGKAKEAYEQILANHPSTAMYVAYGTLLMSGNDFPSAIAQYQKALALEPNNQSALFDIAAAYKNRARTEQQAKDPAYKDDLKQSTTYFEQLRSLNKADANALMNLVENYNILGQKDKVLSLVGDIEALQSTPEAQQSRILGFAGSRLCSGQSPERRGNSLQEIRRTETTGKVTNTEYRGMSGIALTCAIHHLYLKYLYA